MRRLLALAAALLAGPASAQSVAITNARLVIGDGSAPIEGGTVVIRDGRVVAAGRGVAVPADVSVVDAGGKWVTAGIVAGFTRMGIIEIDGVEQTDDSGAKTTPFSAGIDVTPAVNPRTSAIAVSRAAGVTRAIVAPDSRGSIFAGQGAVIDLGADMAAVTRPRAFSSWNMARPAPASPAAAAPRRSPRSATACSRRGPMRAIRRATPTAARTRC